MFPASLPAPKINSSGRFLNGVLLRTHTHIHALTHVRIFFFFPSLQIACPFSPAIPRERGNLFPFVQRGPLPPPLSSPLSFPRSCSWTRAGKRSIRNDVRSFVDSMKNSHRKTKEKREEVKKPCVVLHRAGRAGGVVLARLIYAGSQLAISRWRRTLCGGEPLWVGIGKKNAVNFWPFPQTAGLRALPRLVQRSR